MLCSFQLYSKVNLLHRYIDPLFFRLFPGIADDRVLNRVPCPMQWVSTGYLFFIEECVSVNPNLPLYPCPPPHPLETITWLSTSVFLFCGRGSLVLFFFFRFYM